MKGRGLTTISAAEIIIMMMIIIMMIIIIFESNCINLITVKTHNLSNRRRVSESVHMQSYIAPGLAEQSVEYYRKKQINLQQYIPTKIIIQNNFKYVIFLFFIESRSVLWAKLLGAYKTSTGAS